jgi:hypothetical protein
MLPGVTVFPMDGAQITTRMEPNIGMGRMKKLRGTHLKKKDGEWCSVGMFCIEL